MITNEKQNRKVLKELQMLRDKKRFHNDISKQKKNKSHTFDCHWRRWSAKALSRAFLLI